MEDEEDTEEDDTEDEEAIPAVPFPEPKIIDTGAAPVRKPPAPAPPKKKETGPLGAVPEIHIENYQMPPLDLLDSPDMSDRHTADPA